MVNLENLEALRAEYAALEAENAALRSSVVAAKLAGDGSALAAAERPTSPMARVAILSREQKVLMASLRLGEELVALRKSNEVLFRRGQKLQEENASLKSQNSILSTQGSAPLADSYQRSAPLAESYQRSAPMADSYQRSAPVANSFQPAPKNPVSTLQASAPLPESFQDMPKKKILSSPEEKAERRDMVATLLKAGLESDVHTISALRPNVVPRIQLNPGGSERPGSRQERTYSPQAGSRGRHTAASEQTSAGASLREPSHSAAVEESKYLRELAIRDMLVKTSKATPRRDNRN